MGNRVAFCHKKSINCTTLSEFETSNFTFLIYNSFFIFFFFFFYFSVLF